FGLSIFFYVILRLFYQNLDPNPFSLYVITIPAIFIFSTVFISLIVFFSYGITEINATQQKIIFHGYYFGKFHFKTTIIFDHIDYLTPFNELRELLDNGSKSPIKIFSKRIKPDSRLVYFKQKSILQFDSTGYFADKSYSYWYTKLSNIIFKNSSVSMDNNNN
ncbi:MAG: hypothetical protein ACFFD1_16075, partial [Candidatus Thorarchaeota archaeon]